MAPIGCTTQEICDQVSPVGIGTTGAVVVPVHAVVVDIPSVKEVRGSKIAAVTLELVPT